MSVHKEVVNKLEELLEIVKVLPQGYQYKVRELSACIETVVSMHDDVQRGIIPEVLINMRNDEVLDAIPEYHQKEHVVEVLPVEEKVATEVVKSKLQIGDITL